MAVGPKIVQVAHLQRDFFCFNQPYYWSHFGVTNEMLADEQAFTHTLFGTKIMVKGFFTSVLEAPALNMGVL